MVRLCALGLTQLPHGNVAIIGSKGVALSGD